MGYLLFTLFYSVVILIWLLYRTKYWLKNKPTKIPKPYLHAIFNFEYQPVAMSIIFPLIGVGLVLGILRLFHYPLIVGQKIVLWPVFFQWLNSGILAPFFENIVVFGVIFGIIITYFEEKPFLKHLKWLLLIIIAIVFSYIHNYRLEIPQYLGGLLFGTLYILNDKNLMPPTIAHIAYNLFIIILNNT